MFIALRRRSGRITAVKHREGGRDGLDLAEILRFESNILNILQEDDLAKQVIKHIRICLRA